MLEVIGKQQGPLDYCYKSQLLEVAPVLADGNLNAGPERNEFRPPQLPGSHDVKVWIDQDLCTGDGICVEIAPDVFALLDDGLAYVIDDGKILSEPGGVKGLAAVASGKEDGVIESAEECPGECIFIEV